MLTTALILTAALGGDEPCCIDGEPLPWDGYNRVVKWAPSLADAQTRARDEHKLILYYVLVGDLSREGC